ncbi:PREDICTED: uncharacterized protein LOC106120402 isoform X2 [Papilio xuthus]|uniref:Uncharacterized protein LOC106120402 isoform X2 n=1 Tax=Papilio xuthus TaxID=66420 RepID=A0AAJ6ZFB8_PAPXU|nr:PREDICTED: uncharacterized protein LOC106120402 isoform X2 [Papilio xuthus]
MKSSVALLLFGLVVFVATTSARPNYSETDLSTFDENKELDHSTAQNRQHRRQRRRHSRQISDRLGGESNNNINTIEEDEEDEGRPISFKPVDSNTPSKPFPPVEHGSVQAGLTPISTTTAKPKKTPGVCEAAILLCCRFSKDVQKECFQRYGCMKTYSTGIACSPQAIGIVIQHFKEAYAPR